MKSDIAKFAPSGVLTLLETTSHLLRALTTGSHPRSMAPEPIRATTRMCFALCPREPTTLEGGLHPRNWPFPREGPRALGGGPQVLGAECPSSSDLHRWVNRWVNSGN